MIEIKDLLTRFKGLLSKSQLEREIVQLEIENVTGIKVELDLISIKNGIVYLNTKPIFKNEIFLKKEKILGAISVNFPQKAPVDIR